MPIRDSRFEGGIFFCREVGKIEQGEAEKWMTSLRDHAASSPTPIVILVDAREMTVITPEASKVFNKAAQVENVRVAAIVTSTPLATVLSRMVGVTSKSHQQNTHETHIFNSMEDAEKFAHKHVTEAAGHS